MEEFTITIAYVGAVCWLFAKVNWWPGGCHSEDKVLLKCEKLRWFIMILLPRWEVEKLKICL